MDLIIFLFFLPMIIYSGIFFIKFILKKKYFEKYELLETVIPSGVYYYCNIRCEYKMIAKYYQYFYNKMKELRIYEELSKKNKFFKMTLYYDNPSQIIYENTARASIGFLFEDCSIISNSVEKCLLKIFSKKTLLPSSNAILINFEYTKSRAHKGYQKMITTNMNLFESKKVYDIFGEYFKTNKSKLILIHSEEGLRSPIAEIYEENCVSYFVVMKNTKNKIAYYLTNHQPQLL